MTLGQLAGVKIKISPLFFILLIIAAVNAELVLITVFFSLVLAHEMGHILMALHLNLNLYEIELLPLGGTIRIASGSEIEPNKEIKLAIAGPIVNIMLLAFAILLSSIIPLEMHQAAELFVRGNILLIFFNLLPILPLDGGRIYRALLVRNRGFINATKYILLVSLIMICFLLLLSIVGIIYQLASWSLLYLSVFLLYNFIMEYRTYRLHFMKHYLSGENQSRKKVWQTNTLTADYNMAAKDVIKQFVPGKYNIVIVIDNRGRVAGRLTERQIIKAIHQSGPAVKIKNIE